MFCPKCGQEQAADVPNFCSRCGFQLTEVTSLLLRGAAPAPTAPTQEAKPKRGKANRWGKRLLIASLPFFVLAVISAANEGEVPATFFGLLTFASFVIGSIALIYSWIRGRRRRRSEPPQLGQQTSRVDLSQVGALPPAYTPPVDVPRARFDTGELVEPPSVTEHTTRQLERERPHEREPAR